MAPEITHLSRRRIGGGLSLIGAIVAELAAGAAGIVLAVEAHEAAGATSIETTKLMRDCGWHLLGTARMGTDPARSVVNEWGRSHDVRNLFIVDGSVFVTSGGVNPTSTIQAVALYIADQMKQRLATLFD